MLKVKVYRPSGEDIKKLSDAFIQVLADQGHTVIHHYDEGPRAPTIGRILLLNGLGGKKVITRTRIHTLASYEDELKGQPQHTVELYELTAKEQG